MTTTHAAGSGTATDFARVEAFAGQVSADLTHAYHSILSLIHI